MKAIVAVDEEWSIGKDDELLFHIKKDLQKFKELTVGNTVVMGRKTYESLPIKPLPNRTNIVLSKNLKYLPDVQVLHDISEVKKLCNDKEIFIIGGESIYKQFLKQYDAVYVTYIFAKGNGNKYFPNLFADDRFIISQVESHMDEPIPFKFFTFKRK